jgi:hypothetical protein
MGDMIFYVREILKMACLCCEVITWPALRRIGAPRLPAQPLFALPAPGIYN